MLIKTVGWGIPLSAVATAYIGKCRWLRSKIDGPVGRSTALGKRMPHSGVSAAQAAKKPTNRVIYGYPHRPSLLTNTHTYSTCRWATISPEKLPTVNAIGGYDLIANGN